MLSILNLERRESERTAAGGTEGSCGNQDAEGRAGDRARYKLLFMTNLFYLTVDEVKRLKVLLRDSGITVVLFYAPGAVAAGGLNLARS